MPHRGFGGGKAAKTPERLSLPLVPSLTGVIHGCQPAKTVGSCQERENMVYLFQAGVAQLAEPLPSKQAVAGSSPVSRSNHPDQKRPLRQQRPFS